MRIVTNRLLGPDRRSPKASNSNPNAQVPLLNAVSTQLSVDSKLASISTFLGPQPSRARVRPAASHPSPDSSGLTAGRPPPPQVSGVALPAILQPSSLSDTLPLPGGLGLSSGVSPSPPSLPDLADPSPGERNPSPFRPHPQSRLPALASRVPRTLNHQHLLLSKAPPLPQAASLSTKSPALRRGTPTHPHLRHLLGPAPPPPPLPFPRPPLDLSSTAPVRPAQTRSEGRGRTASGSHQARPRARALGQKGFRSGRNRRGVGGVVRRGGGRVPGQLLLAGGRWRVVTSARPLRAWARIVR